MINLENKSESIKRNISNSSKYYSNDPNLAKKSKESCQLTARARSPPSKLLDYYSNSKYFSNHRTDLKQERSQAYTQKTSFLSMKSSSNKPTLTLDNYSDNRKANNANCILILFTVIDLISP